MSSEEPSPTEIKQAISGMRSAEKRSDIAYNNALKDNEETNKKLNEMAKGNDQLMARIHQIGNRLADPHERSQKISERKEARLRKRIERQYEKTQQLIEFWSKKFIQHIEINNINDDNIRKEDETLNKIEEKLIKYGVNTDDLFQNREQNKTYINTHNMNTETMKQIANDKGIETESDEEQLRNLENMEYIEVVDSIEYKEEMAMDSEEEEKPNKIINIDDKHINFKPSTHRYPGLHEIKPVSAFTKYEPITSTKVENTIDPDIETVETDQNKRYNNLEYEKRKENNALYPSINEDKLKTKFKKYIPINATKIHKIQKIQDDDDLLDDLDDIDGICDIGNDANDTLNKEKMIVDDEDDDLLDELDDVEVPLTMFNNDNNDINPNQKRNNTNPNQKQNNINPNQYYGSQQMYQRPQQQRQNIGAQMYQMPQQNQVFSQNNMNQQRFNEQHVNQYRAPQMYHNNNQNMYHNPQPNAIQNNNYFIPPPNNNNYGNIQRAKSMDSVNAQNNNNNNNNKNTKGIMYPNVKKKNAGAYPNIYGMKKPEYNKPLPQYTKQSNAINNDIGSDQHELDEREFSV